MGIRSGIAFWLEQGTGKPFGEEEVVAIIVNLYFRLVLILATSAASLAGSFDLMDSEKNVVPSR